MSGFESHSEHSEQGGEHLSHCSPSVTQLQVLPLCSPRQGAAPPARDAASGRGHRCPGPGCGWSTPANIRLLPPHAGGRTLVTLAGEQREPGRLEPSQWNPSSPADTRGASSAGHPGSRSCLPPAGRSLSAGRDSPHEGPGREPLLPARLCPPASHPGRGLRAAPASPSLTRWCSTESAVPAGGEEGQSGPAAYIKALYKGGTPGRGQGPTCRHYLRPPAGGSTGPARGEEQSGKEKLQLE